MARAGVFADWRRGLAVWIGAFALACATAAAQSNLPVPKYSDTPEVADIETPPLPDFPKPETLLRFPTSWTSHEIFVDKATLRIDPDGVIRYALVIRTAGGAENVTFEGLRCASGERRVYAYGRRDGTWSPARASSWRPIVDTRANRQYFEFWRDTFCDGKFIEKREALLSNVARGGRERLFTPGGE